jgi:hypothetical protein
VGVAYSNNLYRWQPGASQEGAEAYAAVNVLDQYPSVTPVSGGAQAMGYDQRGNTTAFGSTSYEYDSENRLLHAWKESGGGQFDAQYGYDAFGRRVSKNVDGTWTFFLGDTRDDEIAEYSRDAEQEPVLIRRFVPGPAIDEPIAMVTAAGVKSYFHEDRIGSVIAMSGANGAIAEGPFTYKPFGEVCAASGNNCGTTATLSGVPYRFTGRRVDPESGLYFYRARYCTRSGLLQWW